MGAELEQFLYSKCQKEIVHGLFACAGLLQREGRHHPRAESAKWFLSNTTLMEGIMRHIYADDPALHLAAAYTLAHIWVRGNHQQEIHNVPSSVLDRLLMLRLHSAHQVVILWSAVALSNHAGLPRSKWVPTLTDEERLQVRSSIETPEPELRLGDYFILGNLVIAFHAGVVFTEDELTEHLLKADKFHITELKDLVARMLKQMSGATSNTSKRAKRVKRVKGNVRKS